MKKTVILMLLVCIALPVFADDAMVLPAGVFRLSLAPNYGFVNGTYDNSGKYTDYPSGGGKITAWDAGAALEYGVIDWITAAIQWAPGWNFSSSLDASLGSSKVNVNGLYAAFMGAKFQFVGEKAPITSESVRFALAAGVKVPFGGPNFADQYTNLTKGDDVTAATIDKQTLGLGSRLYADYIFSKACYLNLYSEFIYYPGTVTYKDTNVFLYALTGGNPALAGGNKDLGFGYDLTVELEPHYILPLSDGVSLEGSLPFTLTHSPDTTLGGTSQSDAATLIAVRPTLDLFLMKTAIPFPVEFKAEYSLPLMGYGTGASNALIFIVRVYFKV